MSENCIARAARFGERRKKQQISGGTQRRKNERVAAYQRQQRQQRDGDKSIDEHVRRPHQTRRKMLQQPVQSQAPKQRQNGIGDGMRLRIRIFLRHQILGSRSKYSSSSFLPPSPRPSLFSDSRNSMRSIHLTIL